MKISAEKIIANTAYRFEKMPVYISGNDETYIKKVEDFFIKKYLEIGFSVFNKIDKIDNYTQSNNLFNNKQINILYNISGVGKNEINSLLKNEDYLIISAKNTPKDKGLKNLFKNEHSFLLIECYKLSRQSKSTVLNYFFEKKKIKIDKEVYWYLLENLNDQYAFLSKDLDKISLAEKKINDINF